MDDAHALADVGNFRPSRFYRPGARRRAAVAASYVRPDARARRPVGQTAGIDARKEEVLGAWQARLAWAELRVPEKLDGGDRAG
jgi:hypothetical protein